MILMKKLKHQFQNRALLKTKLHSTQNFTKSFKKQTKAMIKLKIISR